MPASSIDYQMAGRRLSRLVEQHGWNNPQLARTAGVSEAVIRKYASGEAVRPKPEKLVPLARVFGSKEGAGLLYAFGLDALAQELAQEDHEPLRPHEVVEMPEVVNLTALTQRVDQIGQLVEEIAAFLKERGDFAASLKSDKPGYITATGVVVDITDHRWAVRPTPERHSPMHKQKIPA